MKRLFSVASVLALGTGLCLSTLTANVSAAEKSSVNRGTVISTMNNTGKEIQELKTLNNLSASDVQVVNVSSSFEAKNDTAFKNALDRNSSELTKLRSELQANQTLKSALQTNNVSLQNVVGVDVSGNKVIVYYQ